MAEVNLLQVHCIYVRKYPIFCTMNKEQKCVVKGLCSLKTIIYHLGLHDHRIGESQIQ
jgi:hypothetical protein